MTYQKNCTLRYIANELHVHISTVSRVLGGDEDAVRKAASAETIKKIRAFAKECGYSPNPHAKSLRIQQSRLVGVIVPRMSDLVWAILYEGIEKTALEKDYTAYVGNSYEENTLREKQLALATARHVDGLILGDTRVSCDSLDFLHNLKLPFVLALRHTGDHLSVTCDDLEGGRLVAEHLFQQGHRNVGVLSGLEFTSTGRERTTGFVNYYRKAGFPIPSERIVSSNFDADSGQKCAYTLLKNNKNITAIFAVNDFAAIGAMAAIRDANLTLGTSIALVGYNDTPLAGMLPIPLTTVRSPIRSIGEKAMELLIKRIAGEPCQSVVFTPKLIIRESSRFSVHT